VEFIGTVKIQIDNWYKNYLCKAWLDLEMNTGSLSDKNEKNLYF